MRYHLIALASAVVLNAAANLLLKFAAKDLTDRGGLFASGPAHAIKTLLTCPQFILGLTFFALNVMFYFYALGRLKVSMAYPIMVGAGFAIIATVAALSDLDERLKPVQWLGVAMILLGVVLVSSPTNH